MAALQRPRQAALLTRFRRYCGEVLQQQETVTAPATTGTSSSGSSSGSGSSATSAQAVYDSVRLALVPYLQPPKGAASAAAAAGSLDSQARYLMASYGDDVFLNLQWAGLPAWQQLPLEKQFFGTTDGGTVVFQRIDSLLAAPDKGAVVLAKMYQTVLALGFEGDLRGTADGTQRIADYRAELGALIESAEPADPSGHPFPEAYLYTMDQGTPKTLPRVRGWLVALVLLFVLWWALSAPLWQEQTAELTKTLQKILAAGG